MGAASQAQAATPTYYADQMTFDADIPFTVTDDYSNGGYVFIQNDAIMSGVVGESDYMSTGFNNLNIITNMGADPRYCAGCNGSFELSFQTTSVGDATGVVGVGFDIDTHNLGTPYFAFITFADGTTDNVALPGAGNFWGVAAPERIESIHVGLSMGATTTSGSFALDNLVVGDGDVGGCVVDLDCPDDMDPCTDSVCVMDLCEYPFNTDPCDDGELCTEMDICDMGVCGGSTIDCDDGNECTDNSCTLGVGCVVQVNTNPCDDGDLCTEMDVCDTGVCGGAPLDCDDANVCSADSCDPDAGGCVNDPEPDCCLMDDECGADEMCDLDMNVCVPIPAGSTGSPGDTGNPGETGADGTADGSGGTGDGDSGVGDTATPDTDGADTDGDASTSGVVTGVDGGEVPDPDVGGCGCKAGPDHEGGPWWLVLGLGFFVRRRRSA